MPTGPGIQNKVFIPVLTDFSHQATLASAASARIIDESIFPGGRGLPPAIRKCTNSLSNTVCMYIQLERDAGLVKRPLSFWPENK